MAFAPGPGLAMLRGSTWFALLILAALIGIAIYLRQDNNNPPEELASPTPDSQPIFKSEESLPNSLKLEAGELGRLEMEIGPEGMWVIVAPIAAQADPAQAEAAVTQVSALRMLGQVEVPLEDAGLTDPAYTFTLGFAGGIRQLEIGDLTPSTAGYYARLDDGPVMIVSAAGIEGLLGLLSSPPYLETPTPTPSPMPVMETVTPAAVP